ncbi:hypothetical protein A0126_10560 [Exiguobacterium sp. N4-1P]|uniref:hypothetical protein n=1 Tax=Exiguobacterium sp. N4-1P TaxID=2051906 RepID=UPI000B587E6D|nr:hypothetical protein [Exiguobacterium sp. N4-1P]ASI35996.1 hypothetical protein A0126_10560 [Exiguobacterium sp. N4-1P]
MSESRWMERPLEQERMRLARITRVERDERMKRLDDVAMSDDDILYRVYTMQDAFSESKEERERFIKIAESFLTVEGVEQVLALFLFEHGQAYPLRVALRTASPYLPYGLAVKLEEAASMLGRQTEPDKEARSDESFLTRKSVGKSEAEWINVFQTGTYEQQFEQLRGLTLEKALELRRYLCTSYAIGEDVRQQSLIVLHTLLSQLMTDDSCFPLTLRIERLQLDVTFDSAEQLRRRLEQQQAQLLEVQEVLFSLRRLDPFRALLMLSWHQMLHLNQEVDLFDMDPVEMIETLDALAGMTFERDVPEKELGALARDLYDSAHQMLEEGKAYEKTAI